MEKSKRAIEDVILISFFVGFFIFCARYAFFANDLGDRIFVIALAMYSISLAAVFFVCFAGWIKDTEFTF